MFSSLCFSARLRPRSCAELLLVSPLDPAPRPHVRAPDRTRSSRASRSSSGASSPAPLLPAATHAFRTSRSRLIRHTADPVKARAEALVVQRQQIAQQRRGPIHIAARMPLAGPRELARKGADRLAHVAAIDPVAHQRAQIDRDRSFQLDRQIADAAPRVEHIRARKGFGRAGVQTARTRSAHRFPPRRIVLVKCQRRQDFAQKEDTIRAGDGSAWCFCR